MDFVRLGTIDDTTYYPDKLIEGYTSLIWTERFSGVGEFELKSYDVDTMRTLLPEDTLVSHLGTREVMQVETLSVAWTGEGADAQEEITVKGRQASIILESRFVEGTYGKKRRLRKRYTATGACGVLIYNAVDNNSGHDVTRGDDDPETPIDENDYDWNTLDKLPNVCVTDSVADDGESRWWRVEEGMLMPQLQKIMDNQDIGLRILRPVVGLNPGTVMTFASNLADRGTVTRTDTADIKSLRFDLYSGIDRSNTVRFSMLQNHLDNPQYLFSYATYKTEVEMRADGVNIHDIYRDGQSGLSGWRRKVMDFDAGSPELPPEPEEPKKPKSGASQSTKNAYDNDYDNWVDKHAKWKNKRDAIVDDFKEEQTKLATKQLKKNKKIRMFLADVTQEAPYIYGVHYFLGDTVMLYGKYGLASQMVVEEFIRTEDANGERGLPGLVAPDA